jgi:hypothetical protein
VISPALKARQLAHFHLLTREEQAQAIRRMARAGYGEETIASATFLSREMVRQILAEANGTS